MAWRSTVTAGANGRGPILKVLLIVGLVVGLLVPLMLIQEVVDERQGRQQQVAVEIGELWGRAQTIAGPVLVVPASRSTIDAEGKEIIQNDTLVLLPDDYRLTGVAEPETRRRGLFEATVYRLNLEIAGSFVLPSDAARQDPALILAWDRARLALGLSDQRSVTNAPSLDWDGESLAMTPGLPAAVRGLNSGGMQAPLSGLGPDRLDQPIPFSLSLALNGSQSLSFLPLGRQTRATMQSPWPHPSFFGAFVPETHEITEAGFTANWAASYFGRSYPQSWLMRGARHQPFNELTASAFGVRFFQPVDAYHQIERTAKYGVLFVVFTFTALFLFEIITGQRIHIFQYGLVGCALALFYLLLLAFSEQIGFTSAYAVGATAVVSQIVFYTHAVLGSARRTGVLGGLLALLYAGLYLLMQTEDFALLIGAVALFVGLTAIMAVTRRIDWYAIGAGAASSPAGADSGHDAPA